MTFYYLWWSQLRNNTSLCGGKHQSKGPGASHHGSYLRNGVRVRTGV
jgi:hypothetical protein